MSRKIVLKTDMDFRYCTFNNSNAMNFSKPMDIGRHMPIDKMQFIAFRSKIDEGYKLKILSDFKLEFIQVMKDRNNSNYIISVFYIGKDNWDKKINDHDIEVHPPQNSFP